MTDRLTIDDFVPHIDAVFLLSADDAQHPLRLVEASPQGPVDGRGWQPFTLVFAGPVAPLLDQATYPLEHPVLGPLEVFLVPVAQDASETRYAAVFG